LLTLLLPYWFIRKSKAERHPGGPANPNLLNTDAPPASVS
jgi:hypothetical protein